MADPEGTEYATLDPDPRFRRSTFPEHWGAAPVDEEQRHAWIARWARCDAPYTREKQVRRDNAARLAVLTELRYEPSGPVE